MSPPFGQMPDPVDNDSALHVGLHRELYIKELLKMHLRHVESSSWPLETCEYCRAEFYMQSEPVVIMPQS